jgi:hypothetical protein
MPEDFSFQAAVEADLSVAEIHRTDHGNSLADQAEGRFFMAPEMPHPFPLGLFSASSYPLPYHRLFLLFNTSYSQPLQGL